YTVFSTVFFAVLITRIMRQTIFTLIPAYPHLIGQIARRIADHPADIPGLGFAIAELCLKTTILVGCGLFIWRVLSTSTLYAVQVGSQIFRVNRNRDELQSAGNSAGAFYGAASMKTQTADWRPAVPSLSENTTRPMLARWILALIAGIAAAV